MNINILQLIITNGPPEFATEKYFENIYLMLL